MRNISPTRAHAHTSPTAQEPENQRSEGAQRGPSPSRDRGQLEALSGAPARPTTSLEIAVVEEGAQGDGAQVSRSSCRGSGSRRSMRTLAETLGASFRALGVSGRKETDPVMNQGLLPHGGELSDSMRVEFSGSTRVIDVEPPAPTESASGIPQGPLLAGFPETIEHWQMAVHQDRNRRCVPAMIAHVLNDVRKAGLENLDDNHADAIRRIKPEHVRAWRTGIGLNDHDVALMEDNARIMGRFIPSSSTLFNLVNYGLVPWLPNMGSKNPLQNAFISIGIAGLLQPLMTALAQTPIIAALNTWRAKMGPVVALDSSIHSRITPEAASAEFSTVVADRRKVHGEIDQLFREMAAAYGVNTDTGPLDETRVNAVMLALDGDQSGQRRSDFQVRLTALGRQCVESETEGEGEGDLRMKSDQVRMSTGVQERQRESTVHQIAPRIARAATSYVTPIGRWIERAHHRGPTPYTTIAAVGAAAVAMTWQHFGAGTDELEGAANVEEKLNILYGTSYLKPEGLAVLRRGGDFLPEHIDEAKLPGLAPSAASQMLERVRAMVDGYKNALSPTNPEHSSKIAEYEHDLSAIENNDLAKLTQGGDARRLLFEAMGRGSDSYPFTFAAREGWNKLTKLEITAQIGQRLGVAWMLGAFGNVGATASGRLITALNGGSGHASLPVQFAASTVSTMFGAASAVTNYTQVNVKNERRADPGRVSFGRQLWNSVTSPVWQRRQDVAGRTVSESAREAVASDSPSVAVVRSAAAAPTLAGEGSGSVMEDTQPGSGSEYTRNPDGPQS